MKHIKKFVTFKLNEEFYNTPLPEVELETLIPESKIYEEFNKFGYDAFDVAYIQSISELLIIVSPKSKKLGGEFSKNFSDEMKEICENIGADDIDFSPTFQVRFIFDEEKHPELVPN